MCHELAHAYYHLRALKTVNEVSNTSILFPDLLILIYLNHKRAARWVDIVNHIVESQDTVCSWARVRDGINRLRKRGLLWQAPTGTGRGYVYSITLPGIELVQRYRNKLRELSQQSELSS